MLTLFFIGVGGLVTSVGTAVALSDDKDHTSEVTEYENTHPYSSSEENSPYCP